MEDAYLVHDSWHYYMDEDAELEYDARVAGLLADPAAATLEELRIAADRCYSFMYVPPLASLPTTLRVLEIHNCNLEPPPSTESTARLAFPCLADLSLRRCTYLQGYLQDVVDAAPALTRLALVDVTNKPPKPAGSGKRDRYNESKSFNLPLCLRCPTVTTLVLETNDSQEDELDESRNICIQLDMPSLRSFRYKGFPVKLSLTMPAPGLARIDLDTYRRERRFYKCEPAASMLASFSSTRALKLHLIAIEEIISDPDDQSGDQNPGEDIILSTFPNLKLLEIHGLFKYHNNNTALALATLLRACPVLSELRLRLNMASDYHYNRKTEEREAGGPFALSVERFKRLGSMCAEHRDDVDLGAVSDLPGPFTNSCPFGCLRMSLRKVTLQFKSKEVNCFQVQLAKFLVENTMVLEEMHVEDGDQFWPDHLWDKLARWRADAFRRVKWDPPESGWLKANVDGAFSRTCRGGGGGVVFRDDGGAFRGADATFLPEATSAEVTELLACKRAVILALQRGVPKLHLETDCLNVARMLNEQDRNLSEVGILVEEIKGMATNLGEFKASWVRREANKAAHEIARWGLCNGASVSWEFSPPDCILNIVSDELPSLS